jgi:hypothetical protein
MYTYGMTVRKMTSSKTALPSTCHIRVAALLPDII